MWKVIILLSVGFVVTISGDYPFGIFLAIMGSLFLYEKLMDNQRKETLETVQVTMRKIEFENGDTSYECDDEINRYSKIKKEWTQDIIIDESKWEETE